MNIILLHSGIIEIILLFIILIIYYTKTIPKDHLAICLLGTYITLKSITYFIHSYIHKKK
jgi:tryptophan-rich sensory protein